MNFYFNLLIWTLKNAFRLRLHVSWFGQEGSDATSKGTKCWLYEYFVHLCLLLFLCFIVGSAPLPIPSVYAFTLLHFSLHIFQPMFSQGAQTYYTVWFTLGLSLCDLSPSFFSSVKWRKEFWLCQVDVNSWQYLGCYQEHSNYSRNTRTFLLFSLEVLHSLWSLPYYWGRAPAETRAEGRAKTRC